MAPRYAENYTKGVHDRDAAIILGNLLVVHQQIGLLRDACGLVAGKDTLWLLPSARNSPSAPVGCTTAKTSAPSATRGNTATPERSDNLH